MFFLCRTNYLNDSNKFVRFSIYKCMESRFKELYDAPSVMILEVEQEGAICASGDIEQFINGNSYDDSNFD